MFALPPTDAFDDGYTLYGKTNDGEIENRGHSELYIVHEHLKIVRFLAGRGWAAAMNYDHDDVARHVYTRARVVFSR